LAFPGRKGFGKVRGVEVLKAISDIREIAVDPNVFEFEAAVGCPDED
jgi:hypothetical protein